MAFTVREILPILILSLMSLPTFCFIRLNLSLSLTFFPPFDFVVVGGGSAGAVVANRLSEDPTVRVLLLEAGGLPPPLGQMPAYAPELLNTNVDWQYLVAPQNNAFLSYPNRQCKYHAGKVLGGGSSINAMMYVRGNRRDYDQWEALGNTGWGWNGVLPYFLKAEGNRVLGEENDATYHSKTGPLIVSSSPYHTTSLKGFLESGVENGYSIRDINGPFQTGVTAISYTMKNGKRWSTYNAYLEPLLLRLNLFVVTYATVLKVVFDNNKRVTGVRVKQFDIEYFVGASKEVILSAGVFHSPKILLLSGIGPAAELQKFNIPVVVDLPGVGKHLQDHVGCNGIIWKVNCTDCTYNIQNAMSPVSLAQYALGEGPATLPYANEGLAFVNTIYANSSADWPDVEMQYVSVSITQAPAQMSDVTGIKQEDLDKYFAVYKNETTFFIYPYILRPKSYGSVTLNSSDPNDHPNIDFGYITHPDDIKVLVGAVKAAVQIGNSAGFKAFGAQFIPTKYPGCENYQDDEYWECLCRHFTMANYHAVGSCKMGVDDMAVVDPQLRVRNVIGLRVVDMSIAPLIISGNTNAPAIMIGEKASDIVKSRWNMK